MYQFKVVTTAVCSVLMLGKRLSCAQWIALVICMTGTSAVQLSMLFQDREEDSTSLTSAPPTIPLAGLLAVLAACTTSALASVYTEKVLKKGDVSMWVRNFQLAFYCLISACCGAAWKDGEDISNRGFFAGYTPVVWAVIGLVSCGGLVVAIVTKYTDSVIKNLAPACAITISCAISFLFFDFVPTPIFLVGTALTLVGVSIYVNCLEKSQVDDLQLQHSKNQTASFSFAQRAMAAFVVSLLFGGVTSVVRVVGLNGGTFSAPSATVDESDSEATFLLRAVSDQLPRPEPNSRVALYGSILTSDNSNAVFDGLAEASRHFDGSSLLLVVNCSNGHLSKEIPGMVEPIYVVKSVKTREIRDKIELVPWPHHGINTLNEMQVVVTHLHKHYPTIRALVVVSAPFHLPRALLTTLQVVEQHHQSLLVFAHAPSLSNENYWLRRVSHSQGALSGRRVDLIRDELTRIREYSAKGDIMTPLRGLEALADRDRQIGEK